MARICLHAGLLALLVVMAPATPAEVDAEAWRVQAADGPVRILSFMDPDENWIRVRPGDRVEAMHLIQTGKRSAAVLVRHADRIRMSGGTRLEFQEVMHHPGMDIHQTLGRATYTVAGPDPVRIVTPWLVSTATSGTVTVTIEEGSATVEARDGKPIVVSRFTGRATVLDPDHMVRVDPRAETLYQAAVEQATRSAVLD